MSLVAVRMLGQHELLIRLAAGGAANVFLVRDTESPPPGRLLALKILLPQLAANEDFVRMFFTEARIASRLDHPNVVAIAGFGQNEGIYCLAMEYVFGASLAQVLRASAKARKPLTVGVLLRITAAVCDALHYAHELKDEDGQHMGVVHRDVTPQNVLIGFNGVPKLTDFGIAKATNRGWETQAGIVKGKFSYMSPEQALGKKVDRRSDIFCTGIVLWEALTGKELFKGVTPMEVLDAIREQPILPPSKVVPGLSPIVDPIVMKALKRPPRQRYQTALEMKNDIEELIRRAGVTIDAATISREFAEIFGDVIVNRAFALRSAMAGRADLDELARVLGGQKLQEAHIPVVAGGATDPDPLGLFGDSTPFDSLSEDLEVPAPAALPETPFTRATQEDELLISIQEEPPVDVPAEESVSEAEFEPDSDDDMRSLDDADFAESEPSVVEGWQDATRIAVPPDELLAMLSEKDATIGKLPEGFADHFGKALRNAIDDQDRGPDADETRDAHGAPFDDEVTVDATHLAQRTRNGGSARERPQIDATRPMPVAYARGVIAAAETMIQPRGSNAPPLDDDRKQRPIPRAPSLDMSENRETDARAQVLNARRARVAPTAPEKRNTPSPPPPSARPGSTTLPPAPSTLRVGGTLQAVAPIPSKPSPPPAAQTIRSPAPAAASRAPQARISSPPPVLPRGPGRATPPPPPDDPVPEEREVTPTPHPAVARVQTQSRPLPAPSARASVPVPSAPLPASRPPTMPTTPPLPAQRNTPARAPSPLPVSRPPPPPPPPPPPASDRMRAEPEVLELPSSAIMSLAEANENAVVDSIPAVRPVDLDSEEVGLDSDVSMPGGPAMNVPALPIAAAPLAAAVEPKPLLATPPALSVDALRELVATETGAAYGGVQAPSAASSGTTPAQQPPSSPGMAAVSNTPPQPRGIQLTATTLIIFALALLVLGAVAGVLVMRFAK